MFKSFIPINLSLLSVPIHRSEAKEWVSRVREEAFLQKGGNSREKSEAALTQRVLGIQYNSSQRALKWGQPSDSILKAILNCVTPF